MCPIDLFQVGINVLVLVMLLMNHVIYNRETVAVSGKYVAEEVMSNLFYQKVSVNASYIIT